MEKEFMFKLKPEFQKEIFEKVENKNKSSIKASKYLKVPASSIRCYKNLYFNSVPNNILQRIVNLGIITKEDLFLTDEDVYNKLLKDPESAEKLKLLNPKTEYIDNPDDYDFYIRTKVRIIDPFFLENTGLKRLSEENSEYKEDIEKLTKFIEKGFYVKVKS